MKAEDDQRANQGNYRMHLMILSPNASNSGALVVPGIGLTTVVNSYIISTEFGLNIVKLAIPGPFSFLLYFLDQAFYPYSIFHKDLYGIWCMEKTSYGKLFYTY